MKSWLRAASAAACATALAPVPTAAAQSAPGGDGSAVMSPLLAEIVGPPPPVAPALVARVSFDDDHVYISARCWDTDMNSELFVVYNEERDTLARSFPGLANRALIVKINRLFRF